MASPTPFVSDVLVLAPARLSGGFFAVAAPGSGRGGAATSTTQLVLVPGARLSGGFFAVAAPGSGRGGGVAVASTATAGVLVLLAPTAASSRTGRRGTTRSVAAGATSEAGNTAPAADDSQVDLESWEHQKKAVLESWAGFESGIGFVQPEDAYELVCFADDAVVKMKATATNALDFVKKVLFELPPESRQSDLKNIETAGMRFCSLLYEANKGFVRSTSVRAAAYALGLLALGLLYGGTLSTASDPMIRHDLPDPSMAMDDPAGYYNDLGDSFARIVEATELAFSVRT